MEIDLVFKIAAIGIIVAVLNQLLIRSGREDQAMMTTLAGLVVVLSILVKQTASCLSPSSRCLRYEYLRFHPWGGSRFCGSTAFAAQGFSVLCIFDFGRCRSIYTAEAWRGCARSDAGSMGTQPPGGWYCLFLSAALCRDPADHGLRPDTV